MIFFSAGAVTYKLVHMTGEKSNNNMASHSPAHGKYFVFLIKRFFKKLINLMDIELILLE